MGPQDIKDMLRLVHETVENTLEWLDPFWPAGEAIVEDD